MGAGVSGGDSNDELVDNQIKTGHIKTLIVERIFRAVDRGVYFLPGPSAGPYRDRPWKNGNFHLSAPCIYSEALEKLRLKPGLSFLNIGSGTGYFSTMVGLAIGSYGINHGIELHENVIQYAYQRLDEFKKQSGAIDEFDFCEPKFMRGNCFCLAPGYHQYDRIYCGAACPEEHLNYLRELLKIGGILIVPVNERLVEVKRIDQTNWSTHYLLPVSFTYLAKPGTTFREVVPLFEIEPLSLQEQCRTVIRNLLRRVIESEHTYVKECRNPAKITKKKKTQRRDRDDSRDHTKNSEEVFDFFLLSIARKKKRLNPRTVQERTSSRSSASSSTTNNESSSDSDEDEFSSNTRVPPVADVVACCSRNIREDETESNVIVHRENDDQNETPMVVEETKDRCQKNRSRYRHKFDNGLDDELVLPEIGDFITSSSSDEEEQIRKRRKGEKDKKIDFKWKNFDRVETMEKSCDSDSDDNDIESSSEREKANSNKNMMYQSLYTIHMKNKIQKLPLPSNIKKFLNFNRDF